MSMLEDAFPGFTSADFTYAVGPVHENGMVARGRYNVQRDAETGKLFIVAHMGRREVLHEDGRVVGDEHIRYKLGRF